MPRKPSINLYDKVQIEFAIEPLLDQLKMLNFLEDNLYKFTTSTYRRKGMKFTIIGEDPVDIIEIFKQL